ncbi:zinc finger protein 195-like [Lutzomyia longipalpis]|uniref:zinc finger protein 195-like n=1 Tax=Lutzomyia longipalpis TaxID=7200 RepID=UPI002483F316|nr:zinc finger protein 195-like [Lutzomyia longipalpis]
MSLLCDKIDKCRICDETEGIIDIHLEEFSDVHEKLQAITNSEEKYNYWIRFMCLNCKTQLEYLWDFMIRCRNAYSMFVDEIELELTKFKSESHDDFYVHGDEMDIITVEEISVENEEKYEEKEEKYEENDEEKYEDKNTYKMFLDDVEDSEQATKTDHLYSCQPQENEIKTDVEVIEEQEIEILQTDDFESFRPEFFGNEDDDVSLDRSATDTDLKDSMELPEEVEEPLTSLQMTDSKEELMRRAILSVQIQNRQDESKSHKGRGTLSENEPGFKCLICKKIYTQKSGVRQHIARVHLKIQPYMCKVCGKMETHLSKLRDHELSHEKIARFSCEFCGKKLTKMMALKRHKETIHFEEMRLDEKPFICIYCGEDLKQNTLYYEHLRHSHSDVRHYKCRYCPTKKVMKFIELHERIHTEERPFECEFCLMKFKTSKAQAKHELLHKDAPKYPCEVCGKSFTTSSNCRIHQRIHTGETPFGCPTCPKRFYDKKMCKKHVAKCAEAEETS